MTMYVLAIQSYDNNKPAIVFQHLSSSKLFHAGNVKPGEPLKASLKLHGVLDQSQPFAMIHCDRILIAYVARDHCDFENKAFHLFIRETKERIGNFKILPQPQNGKLINSPLFKPIAHDDPERVAALVGK